jgi:fatty-acyl-CoA synthase
MRSKAPLMNAQPPMDLAGQPPRHRGVNKDWLRALQMTSRIEEAPRRTLAVAFDDVAAMRGDAAALLSARENFSFRELAERANRYARWALAHRLEKGDAVCLALDNRADYVAIWLGLTRVGVVVALLNTNLPKASLALCVRAAKALHVIVGAEHHDACANAFSDAGLALAVHKHGEGMGVEGLSGARLTESEARDVTLDDRALYIYTSGTTGLPKAAIVTHRRVMNWCLWFAGLANIGPDDRMYNCLPMYHSIGGVVAVWSVLLAGGSVVLRERFSASRFWDDVVARDCTLFQYIGELCRYLVNTPPCVAESRHRLRLCIGNGLRLDVWKRFEARFHIPRILEFYASTEGNFSLYNVEGEPGAIGRVPAFLAHRFQTAIVEFDIEREQAARDGDGRCIRRGVDEIGEAIARIKTRNGAAGANFEGYLNRAESERKILRDVFEPGDAWMRGGDLMKKDARGFYYFVDRIGDTFRWKGENVSTFEIARALSACPGVIDANVYGVSVAGHEGRAGMAALAVDASFDLAAFRRHVDENLPAYARPIFLRLRERLEITESFKHKKQALAAQGFDPRKIDESLWFAEPGRDKYVRIDTVLHARIVAGEFRL